MNSVRIAAHLRRAATPNNSAVRFFGELIPDYSARTVTINNQNIQLSKREFEIVELFIIQCAGQVFDRERIYELVWGLMGRKQLDTSWSIFGKIRAKLAAHMALHTILKRLGVWLSVERLKNMGLKKSFLDIILHSLFGGGISSAWGGYLPFAEVLKIIIL